MKFEECLIALKAGKKIRKSSWWEECFIYFDENDCLVDEEEKSFVCEGIREEDWEIIEESKSKVKYYPILLRDNDTDKYEISMDIKCKKDSDLNQYSYMKKDYNIVAIRLITEIPELIEEREENE